MWGKLYMYHHIALKMEKISKRINQKKTLDPVNLASFCLSHRYRYKKKYTSAILSIHKVLSSITILYPKKKPKGRQIHPLAVLFTVLSDSQHKLKLNS